jgi:hypothetical protein
VKISKKEKINMKKSEIVKTPKLIFKKGEDILYTTVHEGKTVTTTGEVLEKKSNFIYLIVLDSGHSLNAHINQLGKYYIRAQVFPTISQQNNELNNENEYSRNNVAQSPIVNESTPRDIGNLDPPQINLTSEESRLNSPKSKEKSRKNSDSNNKETKSPEPRRSQRPKAKTKFFGIFHLKGGDL